MCRSCKFRPADIYVIPPTVDNANCIAVAHFVTLATSATFSIYDVACIYIGCSHRCIKRFYVFYSGHVFNVFFLFCQRFFIFKNVHRKYHLKSLSKQRKQIITASFPSLILLDMHGNHHHHHHHHQRTDLGGIMSITSVFTIGPFVPCTPFAKS